MRNKEEPKVEAKQEPEVVEGQTAEGGTVQMTHPDGGGEYTTVPLESFKEYWQGKGWTLAEIPEEQS